MSTENQRSFLFGFFFFPSDLSLFSERREREERCMRPYLINNHSSCSRTSNSLSPPLQTFYLYSLRPAATARELWKCSVPAQEIRVQPRCKFSPDIYLHVSQNLILVFPIVPDDKHAFGIIEIFATWYVISMTDEIQQ